MSRTNLDATTEIDRAEIARLLKQLSYREREIVKLRWGFGDGYRYTPTEVGYIFKVTGERIRQIEANALKKLATSAGLSVKELDEVMSGLP